ncbi:MAG: Hypothetical protein AJITA_00153 [Acetilactobacillus jinshanensis]
MFLAVQAITKSTPDYLPSRIINRDQLRLVGALKVNSRPGWNRANIQFRPDLSLHLIMLITITAWFKGLIRLKRKYPVNRYLGVVLTTDSNGNYHIKKDAHGQFKLNYWRTGRHTKGHFKKIGQVFLTENNLRVAVVAYHTVKYNHRHRYTPLQRFTTAYVSPQLIKKAQEKQK